MAEREQNEDFHTLLAIANRLRDQLNAFRELYADGDVASGETLKWFDNFKRRLDRRRKDRVRNNSGSVEQKNLREYLAKRREQKNG